MQAPSYILAGMIIRRAFFWRYFRFLSVVCILFTALLIHGIFDKIGMACYGPVKIDFADPMWLVYHIVAWLASLVMLYMFWGEYKVGIICMFIPGIDWLIISTANAFHKEVIFYKTPYIHNAINYIIDNVIPLNYLNMLPDNRTNLLAIVWEIVLLAVLALIFRIQTTRRRNIHF